MPYSTDDQMWSVDRSFLGFPGFTFWRPLTYTALFLGFGVMCVLVIVLRGLIHLGGSRLFWTTVILTVVVTRWLMSKLQKDTSLVALVTGLGNELRSPRAPKPAKPIIVAAVPTSRRHPAPRSASIHSPGSTELAEVAVDPSTAFADEQ